MKHTKTILMFENPELSETEQSFLYLMPLVQTAWAHGAVAAREKQLIFAAAREDAIDERHGFNETIDNLLIYQPSSEFFERCLSLISGNFSRLTVKERNALRDKILTRCRAVASAAGGNSPMDVNHHVSVEERAVLEEYENYLR